MKIRLTTDPVTAGLTADRASRRITGTLIPYGEVAEPSEGPARIQFTEASRVTWDDRVILNLEHDGSRPIGTSTSITEAGVGIVGSFSILNTSAGTDALTEAAEGVRGGLSIEGDITESEETDGVTVVGAAHITEAALVRRPAFTAAQVSSVAAAATKPKGNPMTVTAAPKPAPDPDPQPDPPGRAPTPTDPDPVKAYAPIRAAGIQVAAAMPTPGEYLLASLSRDPSRMGDMSRRIRAAAPHTFVAEIPGLIPSQIAGPVLHTRDGSAPVYTALGPSTAPAGASFRLPVVNPELAYAVTAPEKSDVTAQFGVTDVDVAMVFIKRAVNISAEAVAWSQPSVLDVAVTELAEAIAIGSDKYVVSVLEAATGTNAAAVIAVDGANAWSVLSAAVMTQYGASGQYPDRFITAPDVWAKLAGFTNSQGVPLITGVTQSLSGSFGSLFGIPVVVSPNVTAGKAFLVGSSGVKSWTNGSVDMRVQEPTILGYSLGAGRGVGLSVASGLYITPVSIAAAE